MTPATNPARRTTLWAGLPLAVGLLIAAPTVRGDEARPKQDEPPPEEGVVHPDAPDLLGGHWIITVDGGVWVPSSGLLPEIDALGNVEVGGSLHGHLGVGLNRYLVLNLVDGGFARVPSQNVVGCGGCGVWSISVGPSLVLRPTQGFAFDPWVSYGVGYRHNILNLPTGSDKVLGVDVAKLSLGGDWYPSPVFGFGPFLETDIGVRTSGRVTGYAVFHTGLRITFDPVRAGTTTTSQTARR